MKSGPGSHERRVPRRNPRPSRAWTGHPSRFERIGIGWATRPAPFTVEERIADQDPLPPYRSLLLDRRFIETVGVADNLPRLSAAVGMMKDDYISFRRGVARRCVQVESAVSFTFNNSGRNVSALRVDWWARSLRDTELPQYHQGHDENRLPGTHCVSPLAAGRSNELT